jgi:hypothetical protein
VAQPTETTIEGQMTQWGRWRRTTFYAIISVLLLGVTITFWKVNLFPVLAWLPDEFLNEFYASQLHFDHITSGDFAPHTIHYLAIAATHWSFMIGLILQFRDPMSKVAPMWQVTAGISIVTLTYPFADVARIPPPVFAIIGLALVAGFLHPANIFKLRPGPWDSKMSALAALASVPAVIMIVNQVRLQTSGVEADPHWQGLHYNFMGEFGIVLLLLLALGASSLPGWRYSVWTGAFFSALLGVGFVTHPLASSSQGTLWGVTMLGFAIAWLLVAERRYRKSLKSSI